jgi:uncharacterized protein
MKVLRFSSKRSAIYAALVCATFVTSCIVVTSAFAQTRGNNPSFSCRNVGAGSVEDLICADTALSRQDRALAAAYAKARAAVRGSEGYGALYDNQREFLRERAACAQLRTQKGLCISELTDKRITELNRWEVLRMNPARAERTPSKTGTTQGSRPPRGPSFNCARNINLVERAICNDRDLSLLDRQMGEAFARARRNVQSRAMNEFEREQRLFLANRNQCARRTTDRITCITVAYEMRIERLGEWERGDQ